MAPSLSVTALITLVVSTWSYKGMVNALIFGVVLHLYDCNDDTNVVANLSFSIQTRLWRFENHLQSEGSDVL